MRITNSKMYKYVINKPLKMIILRPENLNERCRDAARYDWYVRSVSDTGVHLECPAASLNYFNESISSINKGNYCFECEDFEIDMSNRGRTTCVECACPTEKRRDFSDMSIREFCPRCKI